MKNGRKDYCVGRAHQGIALCVFAAAALTGTRAEAQPIRATIQSIESPAPDLGQVVSATTGNTVFRVWPDTGNVTIVNGTGYLVGPVNTRALVTVACSGAGVCNNQNAIITIGRSGSPTGRLLQLRQFRVAEGTAQITVPPTGTTTITFEIAPIGLNQTKTFWLGANLPIAGDNSSNPTGVASAGFYVSVALANQPSVTDTDTGLAVATVFRPIVIGLDSGLSFGTVTRPREGSGSVTIDAATGNRTVTGTGAEGINLPPTSRAGFTVTGEGGQVISISVPPSFIMSGPGPDLTVTTNHTAPGTQFLSSAIGSEGSFSFHVGGSFPTNSATPTGDYTGSFTVMVQYN